MAPRILAVALAALSLTACQPNALHLHRRPPVPKTLQWLHGSGEAAAISRASFQAMTNYVRVVQALRGQGRPFDSAVLVPGARPDAPQWTVCGTKPSAVILDIDETSILNTGANYQTARQGDPPFNAKRWDEWERRGAADVDPVPGAVEAIAAIRAAGVTPVFISNRMARNAAPTAAALANAGLGDAVAGTTLFLQGDIAPGSGKDPRRAAVAERYCVLAMAGDQLGDFSDLFNDRTLAVQQRRALAQSPAIVARWGSGWFLMPNPVYGPGVAGTLDDLFPRHRRWGGVDR